MIEISYLESRRLSDPVYIDVRSPGEYAEDHIPGAHSVPLLDDEQRKIVGTLYREEGQDTARARGLQLVLPDLDRKMARIRELGADGSLVIYCWRGGMRSRSVAAYLEEQGVMARKLRGGYKEYRRLVVEDLGTGLVFPPLFSLYGLTGTGKTDILDHLVRLGVPVLDLERYANHRGSAFGAVGLGDQPAQKTFETRLHGDLLRVPSGRMAVVEGESRKIGKIHIPHRFFEHLKSARRILIYDTMDNRIRRITREYTRKMDQDGLVRGVRALERRLGKALTAHLVEAIGQGDYEPVVRELLIRHYDPLYKHPDRPSGEYAASVDGSDPQKAAETICNLINQKEEDIFHGK